MENFLEPDILPAPSATIIDRLKYLINLSRKSQAQFGRAIGIDPSTVSKVLSGHLPANEGFLNRIVVNLGVSKSWLVSGEGIPFPRTEGPAHTTTTTAVVSQSTVKRGAPVYDIEATAGYAPLSQMFTEDKIMGYLDLPNLNSNFPVVRVSGDSMTPRIPDGSLISIREIRDPSVIMWGAIYLVQLEDYRMVKCVRRCSNDESKIVLHSENPNYDDIEVNRSKIKKLYLVESIINYQTIA